MLALLAALALSPARVLPEPFLSTRLEPIVPVEHLRGIPRESVARAGSWRPGGLVRLTYYYKFPKGKAPTHTDFLTEPGFQEEPSRFGGNPSVRAARIKDGIRQMISVSDLDEGVRWRWANVCGPATIVAVSEMPMEGMAVPRWHNLSALKHPNIPPGYPPNLKFLGNARLLRIDCEPIIPRVYRQSVSMTFWLASVEPAEKVIEIAMTELPFENWQLSPVSQGRRFVKKNLGFGLQTVNIAGAQSPAPDRVSEIGLTFNFPDPDNAPRIEN